MKNLIQGLVVLLLVLLVAAVSVRIYHSMYQKGEQAPAVTVEYPVQNSTSTSTSVSTSTLSATSSKPVTLSINNVSYKATYDIGTSFNLRVQVLKSDGTPATDSEGIQVVVSTYNSSTGEPILFTNAGGEDSPLDSNGFWTFTSNEKLTAGNYHYEVTAYCADPSKSCRTIDVPAHSLQTSQDYSFVVLGSPTQRIVTVSSQNQPYDISVTAGIPGQEIGRYRVTVASYPIGVKNQNFHLMLPITPDDLLQDAYIYDERGNVVSGPGRVMNEGYNNQLQGISFSNIVYPVGDNIYIVRATIPSSFTPQTTFTLTTTPSNDWQVEFAGMPGTAPDLTSSGTVRLNEVEVEN